MTFWYYVIGAIFLILGRKLFWLFIGLIGFWAGFEFAAGFLSAHSLLIQCIAGTVLGVLGAVLAVVLERVAFAVAGFLAGGYIVMAVLRPFDYGNMSVILFLVGGIIAAAFAWVFMDWAIIALSSMAGASVIVSALQSSPSVTLVIFPVLIVTGILIQSRLYRHSKKADRSSFSN